MLTRINTCYTLVNEMPSLMFALMDESRETPTYFTVELAIDHVKQLDPYAVDSERYATEYTVIDIPILSELDTCNTLVNLFCTHCLTSSRAEGFPLAMSVIYTYRRLVLRSFQDFMLCVQAFSVLSDLDNPNPLDLREHHNGITLRSRMESLVMSEGENLEQNLEESLISGEQVTIRVTPYTLNINYSCSPVQLHEYLDFVHSRLLRLWEYGVMKLDDTTIIFSSPIQPKVICKLLTNGGVARVKYV